MYENSQFPLHNENKKSARWVGQIKKQVQLAAISWYLCTKAA
ncbi:MAG: hypothetical protein ACFWTT_03250 [Lactobacillus delbrueckii]